VAEKENGVVSWLLGDHLGSTAVTAVGTSKTGELRYYAFGGTRYTWGSTPTSYRYTGQRQEESLGLYFYNARWYDPALGRFAQADTIVPSPGNPQSLNRYSYVLNNALKYVDPTGHMETEGGSNGTWTPPPPLPEWDDPDNLVNTEDRRKAEQAYMHFINEPEYFVALYMDSTAWAQSDERAYLDIFAIHSEFHTFADGLLRSVVSPEAMRQMDERQWGFQQGQAAIDLPLLGMVVYRGGSYIGVKGNTGTVAHHLLPDSISPISRDKGMAIQMDPADHVQTSSWGSSTSAKSYRSTMKDLIQTGRIRDALAMEIRDIRSKFGSKYNSAISGALRYGKGAGYTKK
jgi:RHS repeat-associated protein